MKTLKIIGFITIPVLAMVVLSLVAQFSMSVPSQVAPIVETGERWWNPISWALDESASHATLQANKSLQASVSYTQIMALVGAMVAGIGLTLLVMAIRQGWVSKAEVKAKFIEQAPAATHTPPQKEPSVPEPTTSRSSSPEDERDPALAGQAVATATA